MSRNTSFSVGDHFSTFIDEQVSQGRYSNASDVVRAGLRLLEEHEAKLSALREALIAGENSGPAEPFAIESAIKRREPETTKPPARGSLYGRMRGTVQIPDGFDLTAPVFEGEVHAEEGRIHE